MPVRGLEQGLTLRHAALIAGVALLISAITAPIADLYVYPRVVNPDSIEQTARNILAGKGLFLAGVFCYLITFICDLVISWAYYFLLAPAGRSLSLLAAWFRLVHTVVALVGLLNLVTAFRVLDSPEYMAAVGTASMHAQVKLLLSSFRYDWSFSLVFFGIHLGLVGWLVYRSGYIPRVLGILLALTGLGFLIYCLGPYLYPGANLKFLTMTFAGEIVFMFWLLVKGRGLHEPSV